MNRYRLKYMKRGRGRWLSHLDLARAWARLVARAGLELKYSEGFSPRPKMSFSPALSVGVASEAEYIDVVMESEISPKPSAAKLNLKAPMGIWVEAVGQICSGSPSLGKSIAVADYQIVADAVDFPVDENLAADALTKVDITDTKVTELNAACLGVNRANGRCMVQVRVPVNLKPATLVECFETVLEKQIETPEITRLALWADISGQLVDPMDLCS